MSKRLSKRQLREQQELQTLGKSQEIGGATGSITENAKEEPLVEERVEPAAEEEAVIQNNAGAGLFSQVR